MPIATCIRTSSRTRQLICLGFANRQFVIDDFNFGSEMSSRLILVGPDYCLRIPLLIRAGHRVDHAISTDVLTTTLKEACEAILLSDKSWGLLADIRPSSIPHPSVPVIIFQESTLNLPEAKIDLVVRNLEPQGEWLDRIAEVLANSNREDSKR